MRRFSITKKNRRLSAFICGLILSLLSSPTWAVLRTFTSAGVNTLWSNAANWNTGVPVDADTFALAAGQTCTFDVDQSAFAGLGASTIAAGTTLIASTTAGAYVLKMNGNLTVNGTLQAGTSVAVPYPATCTFTINFSSAAYTISVATGGKLYLYCTEPAIKYVKLSGIEAIGQTELGVDTDITGDIWADGDTVRIDDVGSSGMPESEVRVIAAGGRAAAHIDVTAGLTAAKAAEAYVFLITRNIRIIGTTDYGVTMQTGTTGCHIAAQISGGNGGVRSGLLNTIAGTISGIASYGIYDPSRTTFSGVLAGQGVYGFYSGTFNTVSGIISGCGVGMQGSNWSIMSGTITGCTQGLISPSASIVTGTISKCNYGLYTGVEAIVYGTITGCNYGIYYGSAYILSNATLSNTTEIYRAFGGKSYNTTFAGTEFTGYDTLLARSQFAYFESSNHDAVDNAYKAWCLGGIVTSQTASPPTGYSIWYELACESATYPCFRQYETVVLPGTAIEVVGFMRIADAEDHTAYPPRLQIIDKFADPLVDATRNPLDEDQIADYDGSDSSWQAVDVIWANMGDSPRNVIVRMIAKHATGDVDTVWAVADYRDQIAAIYNKLPTHYIMGSSAVTDKDDEIDDILTDTGTTIPGLIAAIPAAPSAATIADTVWDEAMADHTGETTFGGELGTLDPNITLILADTSAYDTDAEHAAAIWNALMATYMAEASFGGEVQQLDPNLTLILADTNDLQTWWANGGRLDSLIDDILEDTNTTIPAQITALVIPDPAGTAASLHIITDALINDQNDLSSAEIEAAVAAALAVYDPPTKDEMDIAIASVSVTVDNAAIADAVHDEVVEGTVTLRQALRLFLSVMTGKSSGGGTTSITFRDISDTKNRLSVTVDSKGNRTAVNTRDGN